MKIIYRKIKSGTFAGDVFAFFPEYRNGEIACFDPVGGIGSMSIGYFADCTEDASQEESAAVREVLESMNYELEEISLHDFRTALFPV